MRDVCTTTPMMHLCSASIAAAEQVNKTVLTQAGEPKGLRCVPPLFNRVAFVTPKMTVETDELLLLTVV